MSDDDWDTDPDFKNDLTEAEKRAYGNRETMEMYQKATGGHGGAVGAQTGALNAPATPAPKMGEVINDAEPVGLAPTPRAEYAAPAAQSPSSTPSGPLPSMMKKESSRRAPFGAAIALTPAHSVERVETERPARRPVARTLRASHPSPQAAAAAPPATADEVAPAPPAPPMQLVRACMPSVAAAPPPVPRCALG